MRRKALTIFAGGLLVGVVVTRVGRGSERAPAAESSVAADPPMPSADAEEPLAIVPVSWWRALFVLPLVLVPSLVLRGIWFVVHAAARRAVLRLRRDAKTPQPPQLLGIVGFAAALALAGAVAAIEAANGVRDRVTLAGLFLVAAATLAASPELLGGDLLRRIDRWWARSELPSHQLAFARQSRRVLRGLRRIGGLAGVLSGSCALVAVAVYLLAPSGARAAAVRVFSLALWVCSFAFPTWLLALILLRLVGEPADLPPEPVTAGMAAIAYRDPQRRRELLQRAAAWFALGTVLQVVAVFLPR